MFCVVGALLSADQNLLAPNLTAVADDFGFDAAERDKYLGGFISAAFFLLGAPAALIIGYLSDVTKRTHLLFWVVILGKHICVCSTHKCIASLPLCHVNALHHICCYMHPLGLILCSHARLCIHSTASDRIHMPYIITPLICTQSEQSFVLQASVDTLLSAQSLRPLFHHPPHTGGQASHNHQAYAHTYTSDSVYMPCDSTPVIHEAARCSLICSLWLTAHNNYTMQERDPVC